MGIFNKCNIVKFKIQNQYRAKIDFVSLSVCVYANEVFTLAEYPCFNRKGLIDITTITLYGKDYCILTNDFKKCCELVDG